MTDKFNELNEAFDVAGDIVSAEPVQDTPKNTVSSSSTEDIKKDYEYTRGNLYSIIEKGQEALNGVLELAQESEMPRAYEVAGQLIKNVADATAKLMELQKKLKDVEEESVAKGPTNVTNALFVGSTAELSKLLKQNKDQEETK